MKPYWHTTGNGQVYGPFTGTLEDYKRTLRRAYGSLRGVQICNASESGIAVHKLLFRERVWMGAEWRQPLALID